MKKKQQKQLELNQMLAFIKENNSAFFKDIAAKFPKKKKHIINNALAKLCKDGYLIKVKIEGLGNICKYTYVKDMSDKDTDAKDDNKINKLTNWKMLVNVFNKLVRMR